MLKKLFLPLFTLTLFGATLIGTTSTIALTNPCASAEGTPGESYCHSGDSYKQYVKEKEEEERKNNIRYACEHATDPEKCMRENGIETNDPPGGNNTGTIDDGTGGTGHKKENDANPTGTEQGYTNPVEQHKSDGYRGEYELPDDPEANLTVTSGCRGFLGMVSWDCNTHFEDADSQDDVPRIVVMIAANIFTDITVIASYLVIAYIIYGGYLYIFANGETSKVTTGKKALNQAFIGLAITLSANIIINAIRIALMHNSGSFTECASSECISADSLVSNLIQWVIGIGGAVAAVFVVGGGIMYMTSTGDPTKLQTAKNIIKYALIGLIIVALSEVITIFMTNVIVDAKKDANVTNDTSYIINTKELYENQKIS